MPNYELVSFPLCPYVQRSVIVLLEKQVEFTRTNIDLSDKPDWFKALSPTGKVPMLKIDADTILFESAVICEYIDDTTPESLFPADALGKAYHRAWIEFGSKILGQISRLYCAHTEAEFQIAKQDLSTSLASVENEIQLPYFSGSTFQMVDAVYATIFRYFDAFESRLSLDIFDHLSKIQEWRQNLNQRPSVQAAVTATYAEDLIAFVKARNSYLGDLL